MLTYSQSLSQSQSQTLLPVFFSPLTSQGCYLTSPVAGIFLERADVVMVANWQTDRMQLYFFGSPGPVLRNTTCGSYFMAALSADSQSKNRRVFSVSFYLVEISNR
jgi:hypothetical protein